jgi:diguanylate cyclase (GGDEF)-like protein
MPSSPSRAQVEQALTRVGWQAFAPALEALYRARVEAAAARKVGRACLFIGVMTAAAIALDLALDPAIAAAAWPWRVAVALLCGVAGVVSLRTRRRGVAALCYGVALPAVMAVVFFAGQAGPHELQDRYAFAAIVIAATGLAAVPLPFLAAAAIAALVTVIDPLLAVVATGSWRDWPGDAVIAAGAMATALAVIRQAEMLRRRRFLESTRYALVVAELRETNRELVRLSNTDSLTGLPNRRAFDAEAARLCGEPEAGSLGAIILDVDHFKQYNDWAGHMAGDVCLRTVAGALARCLAGGPSLLARVGGEEFAVLVPAVPRGELARIGEALRAAVGDLRLPHPSSPGLCVSVSAGLAWRAQIGDDGALALLEEADRALYQAKHDGRNRVAWCRAGTAVASPSLVPAADAAARSAATAPP